MKKSIVVGLAILTVSTSAALAAQRTHHSRAMNPNASAGVAYPNAYAAYPGAYPGVGASAVIWPGGVSSGDRALYIKNLHDSGYNTKNNFNASGNLATQ